MSTTHDIRLSYKHTEIDFFLFDLFVWGFKVLYKESVEKEDILLLYLESLMNPSLKCPSGT